MQTRPFEANLRPVSDMTIIDLHGEINRESEAALSAAYIAAATRDAPAIALNFADVNYINSTGIAVIVGILARARSDGRTLTAFGLSDHYRTIFEITRLTSFVHVVPDEQAAIHEATQRIE